MKAASECFLVTLRLGLTSFDGPVAHVGYFHQEYVTRRRWLSEERFGELMSLTQFIPGPGSSQLGAASDTNAPDSPADSRPGSDSPFPRHLLHPARPLPHASTQTHPGF